MRREMLWGTRVVRAFVFPFCRISRLSPLLNLPRARTRNPKELPISHTHTQPPKPANERPPTQLRPHPQPNTSPLLSLLLAPTTPTAPAPKALSPAVLILAVPGLSRLLVQLAPGLVLDLDGDVYGGDSL